MDNTIRSPPPLFIPYSEIGSTPPEQLVAYILEEEYPSPDATLAILRRDDFPEIYKRINEGRNNPFHLNGIDQILRLKADVPRKSLLAYAKAHPKFASQLLKAMPQQDIAELFSTKILARMQAKAECEAEQIAQYIKKTKLVIEREEARLQQVAFRCNKLKSLIAKREAAAPKASAKRAPPSPELLVAKK